MSDPLPAPVPPTPLPFPLDVATFRKTFTVYATVPDDPTVQVWLDAGYYMVNDMWGPMQGLGQGLWAAHEMAKMAMAAAGAAGGNLSGLGGITASKSVGPVSVSYDNNLGSTPGSGHYDMTMYGRQYYAMMKMFGMGPFQFGPPDPVSPMGTPWQGPVPYLYGNW
jgi:hypothetical protein